MQRTLKIIDVVSANQVFSLFGLNDPNCDKNGNKYLEEEELKCFAKIWKSFVPS